MDEPRFSGAAIAAPPSVVLPSAWPSAVRRECPSCATSPASAVPTGSRVTDPRDGVIGYGTRATTDWPSTSQAVARVADVASTAAARTVVSRPSRSCVRCRASPRRWTFSRSRSRLRASSLILFSSSAVIRLNDPERRASSSRPTTGSRMVRSPPATSSAASVSASTGPVIVRASHTTRPMPSRTATTTRSSRPFWTLATPLRGVAAANAHGWPPDTGGWVATTYEWSLVTPRRCAASMRAARWPLRRVESRPPPGQLTATSTVSRRPRLARIPASWSWSSGSPTTAVVMPAPEPATAGTSTFSARTGVDPGSTRPWEQDSCRS